MAEVWNVDLTNDSEEDSLASSTVYEKEEDREPDAHATFEIDDDDYDTIIDKNAIDEKSVLDDESYDADDISSYDEGQNSNQSKRDIVVKKTTTICGVRKKSFLSLHSVLRLFLELHSNIAIITLINLRDTTPLHIG